MSIIRMQAEKIRELQDENAALLAQFKDFNESAERQKQEIEAKDNLLFAYDQTRTPMNPLVKTQAAEIERLKEKVKATISSSKAWQAKVKQLLKGKSDGS